MTASLRRTVFFACFHLVLTLGLLLYAAWEMSRWDDHFEIPHPSLGPIAQVAVETLMLPGRLVWTSWASRNLSNILEWGLLIANSTLWGLAGSAIAGKLSRSRTRLGRR